VASLRLLRYAGGALKNLRKMRLFNDRREVNFMTCVAIVEV